MAVNGTVSIYRLTTSGQEETDVTDKIEFDGDSAVPDAKSFIQRFKGTMSIIGQENPNPDSNNPNFIDETGLAIVQIELWGIFKDLDSTRPAAITTARDWMKEDKRNTVFPFGRFGIRNNQSDEYDILPSTTYGYVLEHFEIEEDYGGKKGGVTFYAKLRYQGAITGLNA